MKLSEQIKKYRNEKKWTQAELANFLSVTRQTVSGWERDRSYPDIDTIKKLSNLFEISTDDLLDYSNESIILTTKENSLKINSISNFIKIAIIVLAVAVVGLSVWLIAYVANNNNRLTEAPVAVVARPTVGITQTYDAPKTIDEFDYESVVSCAVGTFSTSEDKYCFIDNHGSLDGIYIETDENGNVLDMNLPSVYVRDGWAYGSYLIDYNNGKLEVTQIGMNCLPDRKDWLVLTSDLYSTINQSKTNFGVKKGTFSYLFKDYEVKK